MGDATPTTKAKRTTPVALGEADEMPEQTRDGFWKAQMRDVFSKNPGKVFKFGSVSASTASNLRKDYGLNAVSQTTRNAEGEEVVTLYVKWEPERADEIKREVAERGAKRVATMQANKAKEANKSNANTGRQTAGTRS